MIPVSSTYKIYPKSKLCTPTLAGLLKDITGHSVSLYRPTLYSLLPSHSQWEPADPRVRSGPTWLRALPWMHLTPGKSKVLTMTHKAMLNLVHLF